MDGITLLVIGAAAVGITILIKRTSGTNLVAGWNEVTYNGPKQTFNQAFSSIRDSLVMVYVYNPETGDWVSPDFLPPPYEPEIIQPGMILSINVSQDIKWEY